MKQELSTAVIGATGNIGRQRIEAIMAVEGLNLQRLVDVNKAALTLLADQYQCDWTTDWQAAIAADDTHVIVVSTPNHLHAPIAIAALKAGKHVLVEKPLANSPTEAEEMVVVAEETGCVLKTGFNYPFHPYVRKGLSLFYQSEIGDVFSVRAHAGHVLENTTWFRQPEVAGAGVLLDLGVHMVDLSRRVMGPFHRVVGFTASHLPESHVDESAVAVFLTPENKSFVLHLSWLDCRPTFGCRFEMLGTTGRIEIDFTTRTTSLMTQEDHVLKQFTFPHAAPDPSWSEELREFYIAITEERQPIGNGHDGLEALRLIDAAYQSANAGGQVVLHRSFCPYSQ